jgi:hypothetical protein
MAAKSEASDVVDTITKLFGLLAGIASLAYVGGGAIMALRLSFERLPASLTVAARLSRVVLISVGLSLIIAPMLILGAAYVAYRLVRGNVSPRLVPWFGRWSENERIAWSGSIAVVAAVLILLPAAIWAARGYGVDFNPKWVAVAAIAAFLVIFGALRIHDRLVGVGGPFHSPLRFNSWRARIVLAVIWALAFMPAWISIGAAIRLPAAKLCVTGVDEGVEGRLIDETDKTVFMGLPADQVLTRGPLGTDASVLTVPADHVDGIFVGSVADVNAADCVAIANPEPAASGAS